MADSSVAITSGSGTSIDTRTEATNGNHRQVVVIGDPSTNAGVAPVDATYGVAVDVTRSAALPAGDNNIGNVDIASALPAGTNNIGDVDVATVAIPSTFYMGQTSVTTAGTEVVLASSQALLSGVTVKALHANTGDIYVGTNPVTSSTGFVLDAGEQIFIETDNVADVYIDSSVNGEGVSWIAS